MGRSSPAIRRWDLPRGRSSGAAYPHQRLSALCSPHVFRGAENGQRASGAPPQTGRRSVGFFCGARDDGTSGRHAQTPSPGGGGSTRAKRAAGWGEFSRAKIHPTPAQVLRTFADPPPPGEGGAERAARPGQTTPPRRASLRAKNGDLMPEKTRVICVGEVMVELARGADNRYGLSF